MNTQYSADTSGGIIFARLLRPSPDIESSRLTPWTGDFFLKRPNLAHGGQRA